MADQRLKFNDIYLATEPYVRSVGQVRIGESGIGWKAAEGETEALEGLSIPGLTLPGGVLALQRAEMRRLQWQRMARGYGLRIYMKSGTVHRLDGFAAEDYETLQDAAKRLLHGLALETRDISTKGWNWGRPDFEGTTMTFRVDNRPMFDLPMGCVSNTNLANKNEVSIEFQPPRGRVLKRKAAPDELVEIRFYVPGTAASAAAADKRAGSEDDGENEGNDDDEGVSAASALYDTIKERADLGQVSGDSIVQFSEILCLTPRGRYSIDMFSSFLRLRGKTYDYKIPYDNVQRLFLVSKPDELHRMVVVGLNPPIRQGQTRYPYLVMQFVHDEEAAVDLNFDADPAARRFEGRLRAHYDEPLFRIVANVLRGVTDKRLVEGGAFRSYHGSQGVKASLKANEGTLYPLDKGLLFAPKPALYIPHTDIASIVFSRVESTATNKMRTFDLKLNMHGSQDYQFVSINREEHASIEAYLTEHGIKMLSELSEAAPVSYKGMDVDSDDDAGAAGVQALGLGSDESSEDEDYVADSDPDVPEEFDENYVSPDDDDKQ
ncbi:FACT complex subunit [Coemansia javaensis]|uniref:FACT complex subunit POB3 n=1 Tax=Coemansia javaensis TaxID=2761396 RepID=A0A9W8HGR7_9FUNG|nr:FACT complex subunit [Coemansia javaensis]